MGLVEFASGNAVELLFVLWTIIVAAVSHILTKNMQKPKKRKIGEESE